jgi:hypothetical protein
MPSRQRPRPSPLEFDITRVGDRVKHPLDLRAWLDEHMHTLVGPSVTAFAPGNGPRGTVLTIDGGPFSPTRWENDVVVGGAPAFVLSATPTRLEVLTGPDTDTGPVEVTVPGGTATSAAPFTVTG